MNCEHSLTATKMRIHWLIASRIKRDERAKIAQETVRFLKNYHGKNWEKTLHCATEEDIEPIFKLNIPFYPREKKYISKMIIRALFVDLE